MAALAVGWLACGEDPVAPPPNPPPLDPPRATTLGVTPARTELAALGAAVQLSADVRDQTGQPMAGVRVAWSGRDPMVATVDSAGLVTAVGRGETRIVAAANGISGEARVTVRSRVDSVAVVPPADTIAPGDTLRLAATAFDPNGHPIADAEFAWSSTNPSVVTVDSSGLVLGTDEGVATILARTDGAKGNSEVTVVSPDRTVLEAFYAATGGPEWRDDQNWLTDAPLERWVGVRTTHGRVTGLYLHNNNLRGRLPPVLVQLTKLEDLWLNWNKLTGPIPVQLANLTSLTNLSLPVNELQGSIPPELGALESLELLQLQDNDLSGGIPSGLANLANLEKLSLDNNRLTGGIPPELGRLAALKRLSLHNNDLTGSIPLELGDLSDLEELALSYNELTGPVPPELGKLKNLRALSLIGLYFSTEEHGRGLTGPIPPELGRLTKLERLSLGQNSLSGPVPPELGHLVSLRKLHLSANRLTDIPGELGKLYNLEEFSMQLNPLTGPIPPELGNLANLRSLNLSLNASLTGPIPPELGKLTNLGELHLWGNQLTGSIPPELGDLANLEVMNLSGNDLTGVVPMELGNLVSLESLLLRANGLTTIAGGLGGMRNLLDLDLAENRFASDGLPPGVFSNLPSLEGLDLGRNQLTELPTGMFLGLPRLSHLRLEGNPGAPFTLTLEARRIDEDPLASGPASVEVHVAEGAPVDLKIPLSAHGGTISATAVVLETGSDRSAAVTVTRDAESRSGTEVVAGPLPVLPRRLSGLQLEVAGSLVLFGDVSNQAPVPARNLPWMRIRQGDRSRQITVSSYFEDPDGDRLEYSAASGDPGVVSTSVRDGRLTVVPLAPGSTSITVTAEDRGGLTAASSLPVSVRGMRRGSYAIDLIMVDSPRESVQAVFDDAIEYWESILADTELPDIPVGTDAPLGCNGVTTDQSLEIIDDLAVVASVGQIDGPGRVLGWAALCGMREESRLPLIGALRFDAEDLEALQESDALEEVILHEIGHLLGIGTVWNEQGLLVNPSLRGRPGTDTHFRGPMAIAAFNEAGGEIYTGGEKVPVENYAGRSAADAHWRESVLDHELMTPTLSLGVPNPLSAITIQSLADMGYFVDVSLAETFRLPGAAARAPGEEARKIEYGDDVRRGPIIVFDRDGRAVRGTPN